jgi:hypothetical protein
MNGNVHDFTERLGFSHAAGDEEAAWVRFYQDAWPNALLIVRVDAKSTYQQFGIDRHVYLPSGKILAIDEKVRDPKHSTYKDGEPYDDFMIEVFSVWKGERHPENKIGWTLDAQKHCDYIAYAIPLVHRCYLLPFELLRLACTTNLDHWKTLKDKKGFRCYPLDAPNRGYVTKNCAVSWDRLFEAMKAEMKRLHGSNGLTLPVPTIQTTQAVFDWVVDEPGEK